MLKRDEFFHLVRDALNHLDDLPFLETSPLAQMLAAPGEVADGTSLRRRLLDAVQRLRPSGSGLGAETAWRRYRCIYLRHVEGADAERVRRELQVSGRQMRRDSLAGLEAVVALLWPTYVRRQDPSQAPRSPSGDGTPQESSLSEAALLETELAKLGSSPAEGPLNVERTVLGAVDTITRLAESRGVHVRLALPPQLPPAVVDRAVLRQVLLNLLTFAVEGDSGRQVEVGGRRGPHGVELHISIRPVQRRPDLLGDHRLMVSERLIALQGGALRLEMGAADELIARINISAAPPATVLVIDDNPDLARLFQRYLWAGGYQMLQASTGSQALRLAREARPRVITLDVMMPSQDGWEVLRELQRDPSTIGVPVIVCSVLHERDLAFSLGAADFLAKPVSQQALLAALERCLSSAPALEPPLPQTRP